MRAARDAAPALRLTLDQPDLHGVRPGGGCEGHAPNLQGPPPARLTGQTPRMH
jgi:hypothetical protein